MRVFVSGSALAAARRRLLGARELVETTTARAVPALSSIGLGQSAAATATLLAWAAERINQLEADHATREVLAADLEGVAHVLLSPGPNREASLDHDARLAAAEERVALLEAAPPFPGRYEQLTAARERLLAARLGRLAGLVASLDRTPERAALCIEADRHAVELGLTPLRLALVARALRAGHRPEDVDLPPWLFPRWYAEAWRASERRRRERHQIETAMWRAAQTATEAWIQGDGAGERDAWDAYERWAARWEMAPPMPPPQALGLLAVIDFLSTVPYLSAGDRQLAIAQFLVGEIESDPSAELVEGIGGLIGWHLTTPDAAAAFFNALDVELLAAFPFTGPSDTRLAGLIEPYSQVLALASHSPGLEVDGTDLVGAFLRPNSAAWLGASDYETGFLVSLAAGIVAASAAHSYVPWIAGWPAGAAPPSGDPRVNAAARVVTRGPAAAVAFLSELSDRGLLADFVAPVAGYADQGAAAGAVLALVGASDDARMPGLVAAVTVVIAGASLQAGVREGAAAMIVPHLTSLVDPRLAYDIELSAAAEALENVRESVNAFLGEILREPAAVSLVLTALTLLLFGGIDRSFDPDDPESVADTMRGFGHVADLVTDAYLSSGLAAARAQDAVNARLATVVGFAADLAVAGGLVALGPATAAAIIASEVTAAGVTGVILPALLEVALPTDAAESTLAAGYELENQMVHEAELYLLAKLDAAGMIELPDAWWIDGRLVVDESDLRAFEASLTGTFPYAAWVNDAVSIGGSMGWQPAE